MAHSILASSMHVGKHLSMSLSLSSYPSFSSVTLTINIPKHSHRYIIHSWAKAIQTYLSAMANLIQHHKLLRPLKNNKLNMLQEWAVPFIGIASFKMTGNLKRPGHS